jgi:hypothetical protein
MRGACQPNSCWSLLRSVMGENLPRWGWTNRGVMGDLRVRLMLSGESSPGCRSSPKSFTGVLIKLRTTSMRQLGYSGRMERAYGAGDSVPIRNLF